VTVICSDKTGTLTRNEMTVREIVVGGARYHVTGVGYAPRGQFVRATAPGKGPVDLSAEPDLIQALRVAGRCNNARVSPRETESESWQVLGDPTEGALLVAALKGGIDAVTDGQRILYEIPFDSERKAMSVVVGGPGGGAIMYTKGAPEVIVEKCVSERRGGNIEPLTDARRQAILLAGSEMAARALRVLALAYREHLDVQRPVYMETELIFSGLVGIIDPPREEVKDAVDKCHRAGIQPVMITGDHPATALAIARELGMAGPDDGVLTGAKLNSLSDEELANQVERLAVYARVSPEHKLRVVRAWQSRGEIVAMTGDGVNDAPAVQTADIGIAMGLTGTDVTKEASDMVLTDDNFASIVNAVEEGRAILDNIQKFLHYLLASNASEVLLMLFAALVGWPAPLLAIQILWINLMTDSLPALALAIEPPERDIMRRRPRPPHQPVITWQRGLLMLYHGVLIAAVAAIGFVLVYKDDTSNLARARTVACCTIAYAQLFFSLGCRSQRYTMPELGFFSNPTLLGAVAVSFLLQLSVVTLPFARPVFESAVHFGWEWMLVFGLALVPVTIVEVLKIIRRRLQRPPEAEAQRSE
jgi:Ca2+-transporting ATPase